MKLSRFFFSAAPKRNFEILVFQLAHSVKELPMRLQWGGKCKPVLQLTKPYGEIITTNTATA